MRGSSSESILSKLQYRVVLVTKATFGLGKKAVLPAVRCACAGCSVVPLVLFRAIVLLTSRVHECDYMYWGAGKYILHCTGWCSSRPARTEPGLEPFAFRAARGGSTCAATAAVALWRRGKAYTD